MLINLLVTNMCNMSCDYCYEKNSEVNQMIFGSKDKNNLVLFIKRYLPHGESLWINFHGGEPLLNFEIIKKIVFETQKICTCRFSITTNATLLTKEIASFLEAYKFFISLSIDGGEDVYNKHRKYRNNQCSFKDVINNINYLNNIENIRYRMTITPDTVENLYDSIKFIISLQAKAIVVVPDYNSLEWHENKIKCFILQLEKANREIKNIFPNVTISSPIVNKKYGECCGGEKEYTINANGDVFPCVFVCNNDKYRMGNIGCISNINRKLITDEKNKSIDKECNQCRFLHSCIAQRCIYLNSSVSHDILCRFRKAVYE